MQTSLLLLSLLHRLALHSLNRIIVAKIRKYVHTVTPVRITSS